MLEPYMYQALQRERPLQVLSRTQVFFRQATPRLVEEQLINLIRTNLLIKFPVVLNGRQITALLDLGAQGNYISRLAC